MRYYGTKPEDREKDILLEKVRKLMLDERRWETVASHEIALCCYHLQVSTTGVSQIIVHGKPIWRGTSPEETIRQWRKFTSQ